MAIDPVELSNGLGAAVARARRALAAKGELSPPRPGRYESPLSEVQRAALVAVIREGAYAAAVAEITAEDPELADG